MSRWFVVVGVLCCLLVVAGAVAGGQGPARSEERSVSGDLAADSSPPALADVDDNFTSTEFVLTVYPNQSVRWTYVHKTPLESDARRQWFDDYAAEFRNGSQGVFSSFRQRAVWLAENGSAATDRSMAAVAFDRDTRIEGLTDNLGVVSMSFRWENFARQGPNGPIIDDVFSNGLYIGPNQTLTVKRTDSLSFDTVAPAPDSSSSGTAADSVSVTWNGEREFNDFRPRVVLAAPNGSVAGGERTDSARTTAGGPSGQASSPSGSSFVETLGMVVLAAIVLTVLAAGVWLYQDDRFPGVSTGESGGTATAETGATTTSTEPASAEPAETEASAVTDEQFLSDEQRVMELLTEEGGRMKQSRIVEETDWSKSKVSMLLTDMEDDDDISKLRVGRENIISLPGQEPEAARSPFDDEE